MIIQINFTCGSKEEAERISNELVDSKLVACVQITGPITSVYYWKDSKESSQEWLCFAKSLKNLYGDIERRIKSIHSYENPEILSFKVNNVSKEYEQWLLEMTNSST